MKIDNLWLKYTEEDVTKFKRVCDRYKQCLDDGKTERECVAQVIEMAQQKGYRELHSVIKEGGTPKAGDKLWRSPDGQEHCAFSDGEKPVSEGA